MTDQTASQATQLKEERAREINSINDIMHTGLAKSNSLRNNKFLGLIFFLAAQLSNMLLYGIYHSKEPPSSRGLFFSR